MSILIEGMEMPKTGLYFVSVDNSKGRDKTVVTVERMLGNRDVRQIVGMFELIPVPEPHGDLVDRDKLRTKEFVHDGDAYAVVMSRDIWNAPTIIPASASEEGKND